MLRKKNRRNYNLVDQFSTIMFIDSTLGYEAISRGKKIISIPCRMKNKKFTILLDTQPFPQKIWFFYTNSRNEKIY